jgi:hypothetical protein
MKVGFAIFCTGKYRMFLDKYVKTCEEKFLKNSHKKYFIFTDEEVILDGEIDYQWIPLQKMGWPYDTLRRYAVINKHKEVFDDMDYLLSTNVNMYFNEEVTEDEIIPTEEHGWMASVHHPNWFDKEDTTQFPYERNSISTAYVAPEESGRYLQACFIVGRKEEFLKMSQYVEEQSELDISNHNFIAIEGELNCFSLKSIVEKIDKMTLDEIHKIRFESINHIKSLESNMKSGFVNLLNTF